MRILSPDIIIFVIIVLTFVLSMLVLNIRLFIRHGRSTIVYLIHTLSILSVLFASTQLIIKVSFDFVFFTYYRQVQLILLLMILFVLIYTLAVYIKNRPFHIPPDFHEAFNELDELILVYDYKGDLTLFNHKNLLDKYFGGKAPSFSGLEQHVKVSPEWTTAEMPVLSHLWILMTPILINLEYLGSAFIFYDITEEKMLYETLYESNKVLSLQNEALKKSLHIHAEFEAEKIRNDTIISLQSLLLERLEKVITDIQSLNFLMTQEQIEATAEHLRETYGMVREAVKDLSQ